MQTIQALFIHGKILTENSSAAQELYEKNRYGTLLSDGRVQLGILEALYLVDKKRLTVVDGKNKSLTGLALAKKAKEHDFLTRYAVYKDFRDRGYIIKTALKFGADFRIYARVSKP